MKELCLIGLFTLFALVSAKPWYSNGYLGASSQNDDNGSYHARSQVPRQRALSEHYSRLESLCQSTTHEHNGLSAYIHICEIGEENASGTKQYCFLTNGSPCCSMPTTIECDRKVLLRLSNHEDVSISYYHAAREGFCYAFERKHSTIRPCCNRQPYCTKLPDTES